MDTLHSTSNYKNKVRMCIECVIKYRSRIGVSKKKVQSNKV